MTRMTNHIPKLHDCITYIDSFIAYHKNDLDAQFPNQTVELKDITWSSLHYLHAFCLGETNHAWLI